ncbi:hypothetical protein DL769_005420 [Monosporascus sp. CRB-8-3]|nr:hypothetical protein DL769_005420 [Monosporascus sp. CRB-8-3]
MDYTYRAHLESGNYEAASEAIEALPRFNNFTEEPRDFGRLLSIAGEHGRKALQHQIGNPVAATTMAKYKVEASLYLSVTVLLHVDDGVVAFEYDRPRSMMRQFRHTALYEASERLDCGLYDRLCEITGRDEHA